MIRYSLEKMDEIDKYFNRLRSRSEDVAGYLQMLISEMMADDQFMKDYPGEDICDALNHIKVQTLEMNDKISSLAEIHKELTAAYQRLEKKHFKEFDHLKKSMNLAKSQYQKRLKTRDDFYSGLLMGQEESALLHKILTGKPSQPNRSPLGRLQLILKEQYHFKEVGRDGLDT